MRRRPWPAAIEQNVAFDALRRNAVGRIQDRVQLNPTLARLVKVTEEGRLPVVCVELEAELWVGDDASSALADGRGAWDRGQQRRKAEEDLLELVVRR